MLVSGAVGGTAKLAKVRVKTTGTVAFDDIIAKTVNLTGSTIAVGDVTSLLGPQIYKGDTTFSGALTGKALKVTAGNDITNSAPWIFTNDVTLKTTAGNDINITGASNQFGTLTVVADNATINEADATNIKKAKLNGDLTLTSGGAVTESGSVRVHGLAIDASGSINLGGSGNRLWSLEGITAVGNILIRSGGHDLVFNAATSTTNGDIVIVADSYGTQNEIINLFGSTAIAITGTGRYVLYSFDESLTNLGGLTPDFEDFGYRYPTASPNPGDSVLYAQH